MKLAKHIVLLIAAAALLTLTGCVPMPSCEAIVPRISGQVLDAKTRKPIKNAKVAVEKYPITKTHSDAEGRFLTHPVGYPTVYLIPLLPWDPRFKEFHGNLLVSHDDYFTEKAEWSTEVLIMPKFSFPQLDLKAPILLTPRKP